MTKDLRECVIICEGKADKVFLDKLFISIGLRDRVTIPFHEDNDGLYGVGNFGRMVEYVIMSNPSELEKVKLFLFVADSTDNPGSTFSKICKTIESLDLPAPERSGEPSAKVGNAQQTFVMLLPGDSQSGCLETLYYKYLKTKYPNIDLCHNKLISCLGADQKGWNIEKRHKSIFHATVAATFKKDPSRSASSVFNSGHLIDINDNAFDDIKTRIKNIFTKLEMSDNGN